MGASQRPALKMRSSARLPQARFGTLHSFATGIVPLWAPDDPSLVPEGRRTHVIVPRDALLMFPTP